MQVGANKSLVLIPVAMPHPAPQHQVWVDAAVQIFFSIGVGWGSLTTMSSFNKYSNPCLKVGSEPADVRFCCYIRI